MNHSQQIYVLAGKNPLERKSGYASYAYSLCKTLKDIGYTPKIFCFGQKDEIIKSEIGKVFILKSNLLTLSIFRDQEMGALFFLAPRLAFKMLSELKSDKSAIIWGIGPWSLGGVILKLFVKKIPLLADYFTTLKHEFEGSLSAIEIRDYGLFNKAKSAIILNFIVRIYSHIEAFVLNRSNRIIVHYASTKKIISSEFSLSKTKFAFLPFSIYEEDLRVKNKKWIRFQYKRPLIMLVSRHDGRKGINYLLRSFALLNNRGIKYSAALIGKGKLFEGNKNLALKLKLKNVHLLGYVSEPSPLMKMADIYVFPSVEEGSSSLSILEAMKEGLPIVSTNVDGIPEDIENGVSGLLVAPKDSKALADAIQVLIENTKMAKKMGREAKRQYKLKHNSHDSKKEIGKLLRLFKNPNEIGGNRLQHP